MTLKIQLLSVSLYLFSLRNDNINIHKMPLLPTKTCWMDFTRPGKDNDVECKFWNVVKYELNGLVAKLNHRSKCFLFQPCCHPMCPVLEPLCKDV